MRVLRYVPFLLLVALGVATPAQASGGGPRVSVVASGLDSPRHLAFGARGDLFVAEAGRGGSGPCFWSAEGDSCMGASGAVTRIDRWGHQRRIAKGLASFANRSGASAIGPHGITVVGADHVIVTNGGPTAPSLVENGPPIPHPREYLAARNRVADLFGRVVLLTHHGWPVKLADVYRFEETVNPDGGALDSNPVDVHFDGHRLVVADAGGNFVATANVFGRLNTLAVFPNGPAVPPPFPAPPIPPQAVPTAVVEGPDGFYYVGQLTGFPFPVGGANVFRVNPRTGAFTTFASGFTNIMDLAFDRDGTLYVLEIDHDSLIGPGTDGAIFAINRKGTRRIELPAGALPSPGGIAVGKDGLYVTTNATSAGGGQVVRIRG
jgi:hypothetical protein